MLRRGGRFMVVSGKFAGMTGTIFDIDRSTYPEITAILDVDKNKSEEIAYNYFAIRDVTEVK